MSTEKNDTKDVTPQTEEQKQAERDRIAREAQDKRQQEEKDRKSGQ